MKDDFSHFHAHNVPLRASRAPLNRFLAAAIGYAVVAVMGLVGLALVLSSHG